MTQHTPGPWKADISADNSDHCYIRAHQGQTPVATVLKPGRRYQDSGHGPRYAHEYQANRALIEAAPALLAALRRTLDYLEVFAEEAEGEALEATGRDIEQVQAAITAATGETFTTGQALNGVAP